MMPTDTAPFIATLLAKYRYASLRLESAAPCSAEEAVACSDLRSIMDDAQAAGVLDVLLAQVADLTVKP